MMKILNILANGDDGDGYDDFNWNIWMRVMMMVRIGCVLRQIWKVPNMKETAEGNPQYLLERFSSGASACEMEIYSAFIPTRSPFPNLWKPSNKTSNIFEKFYTLPGHYSIYVAQSRE